MANAIIDGPVISGFLDVISSDVAAGGNRQALGDRHVYGFGDEGNWRRPNYRELGLMARRSRPGQLSFYGQDGARWFEVVATRSANGWRVTQQGEAPADLLNWLQ